MPNFSGLWTLRQQLQAIGPDGGGGVGAVRIIYSTTGVSRSFPSTNTGNL